MYESHSSTKQKTRKGKYYKTINENTIQIPTKLPIILSFNDLGLKIFW